MTSKPADKLGNAPFSDVLLLLLGQFQGLLAERGLNLNAGEARLLAQAAADSQPQEKSAALNRILARLVNESLDELEQRWRLDFAASLSADMNGIGHWETTAEFLETANDKLNAELRISAGSALLTAGGRLEFARYLCDLIKHDAGVMDVDALIAKRVLLHVSAVDGASEDWFAQVQNWLRQQSASSDALMR